MDDNQLQESIAVLKQDINQARIVAAEPTTHPEILRELALFDDEKIREAVVSNANTSPEVLVQLGEEFPSQFLDNPVFPLLLLENPNFIQELPLFTLRSILIQENCPEYILEQAADKADLEVQLALANNIKTSRAILNRFNQSRYSEVVEAVNLHVNFVGELMGSYEEKIKTVVPQSINSSHRVNYNTLAVLAQIFRIPEFIIEHWLKESMNGNPLGRLRKKSMNENPLAELLADSPATPQLVLKHLGNHSNAYTQEKIAQNINTPVETLRKLTNEAQERQTRIFLARNVNTPLDALNILSKDKDKWVRMSVVENPNTPLSLLEEMINDMDEEIARNAKQIINEGEAESLEADWTDQSSTHVLEKLANDDSSDVRQRVAANPYTPLRILFKQLARDTTVVDAIANQMSTFQYYQYNSEAENILDILAEESTSPLESILQRLIREGGGAAHLFLARRFDLPSDLLVQLTQSPEFKVREAVAQNPNTPSNSLEKLAQASELNVREAVAKNPNTPTSALDKLAKDKNSKIRIHTASQLNLSTHILEELTRDKSTEVRYKAMMNPSLSKDSLERIICSENAYYFLKLKPDYLSHHPDIKDSLINHYAHIKSTSMWVNYITLIQPEVSQDLLKKKSNSVFWIERLAVAQNPQIPQNILDKLAKDSNQLVRAAAKH